jgi:hypothetical protein
LPKFFVWQNLIYFKGLKKGLAMALAMEQSRTATGKGDADNAYPEKAG